MKFHHVLVWLALLVLGVSRAGEGLAQSPLGVPIVPEWRVLVGPAPGHQAVQWGWSAIQPATGESYLCYTDADPWDGTWHVQKSQPDGTPAWERTFSPWTEPASDNCERFVLGRNHLYVVSSYGEEIYDCGERRRWYHLITFDPDGSVSTTPINPPREPNYCRFCFGDMVLVEAEGVFVFGDEMWFEPEVSTTRCLTVMRFPAEGGGRQWLHRQPVDFPDICGLFTLSTRALPGLYAVKQCRNDITGQSDPLHLVRLYPSAGSLMWERDTMGDYLSGSNSLKCDASGEVYLALGASYYGDLTLTKHHDLNGDVAWSQVTPYGNWPFFLDDPRGRVVKVGGGIAAYDMDDGHMIWSNPNFGGESAGMDPFGNIYTYGGEPNYPAVGLTADGELMWEQTPLPEETYRLAAVDNSANIYQEDWDSGDGVIGLRKLRQGKVFRLRDRLDNPIANCDVELIKVDDNAPVFTEHPLATLRTDDEGKIILQPRLDEEGYTVVSDRWLLPSDHVKFALEVPEGAGDDIFSQWGLIHEEWLDNATFEATGQVSFDSVSCNPVQRIVLDHTEVRISLIVSVEWDAKAQYQEFLQDSFRRVSNYLYDVTDGQFRLDSIQIFDNNVWAHDADVLVLADNQLRPNAELSGAARVRLGRKWYGDHDRSIDGNAAEPDPHVVEPKDWRVKAHELGHLCFRFRDEYKMADGSRRPCSDPPNFGFMDDPHECPPTDSRFEYSTEMSNAELYQASSCGNTMQFAVHLASCWSDLWLHAERSVQIGTAAVLVPIVMPGDPGRPLLEGRTSFCGPNEGFYDVGSDYDVGRLVEFPVPITEPAPGVETVELLAAGPGGQQFCCSQLDVDLLKAGSSRVIYQGKTTRTGRIFLLGAAAGDAVRVAGVQRLVPSPAPSRVRDVAPQWYCGEAVIGGSGRSDLGTRYATAAAGDSVSLEVRPVAGDYPVICRVELGLEDLTYGLTVEQQFSAEPTVDVRTSAEDTYSYPLAWNGTGYSAIAADTLRDAGTATVSAVDDSSAAFFFPTRYMLVEGDSTGIPELTGMGAGCSVRFGEPHATLQRAAVLSSPYPVIRAGLEDDAMQGGEAHCVAVYPSEAFPDSSVLTVGYKSSDLEEGSGLYREETSLGVFRWDESLAQWSFVGGMADTIHKTVSVQIAEPGVYAAFTTELATTGLKDDGPAHGQGDGRFELRESNPFARTVVFEYEVLRPCNVDLSIYNLAGRRVATIEHGLHGAGGRTASWDAVGLPSGVYFARLQRGPASRTIKVVLMK